ncbi:SMI1/KNR4 family protein [Streptomyces californicus]|uniref:SMI1/KNR4 family protein n=1 Tax=Streptomyces californicus TaxID=67351 RepID=UPI000A96A6D9|nr:SMI1/KNR4 family protein [Streptomyces californicus]
MIRRLGARTRLTRLTRPPVRQPAGPPPLTEAEAAEAEEQLGVVLPPEYRRHLLEVSAGGETFARLERTADGWWWPHNTATRRDLLALPFPHPDSYKEADEALARREPRIEDHPDDEAYARAMTAWDDEAGEFEDRKTAGAVVIKEHGCGFATLLAVTGPLAGTVWWDGRATCDLILPLSLNHATGARPVTFGEWLEHGSWNLLPPGW